MKTIALVTAATLGISLTAGTQWGQARAQAAAPAAAQERPGDDTTKLAEELIDCAGLTDPGERLDCYDGLAKPLMGLAPQAEAGSAALHQFTGKGDWDSEVLEIGRPWRLVWQNQGSLLTVELHTTQGEMIDVIGNQIGEGAGRSELLKAGSYRLAIRGLGSWRVQVVGDAEGTQP